jgi:putative peptide zinc metalloprotease protein
MDRLVSAAALPALREDLRLHAAASNADGSPAWVIQDPARNRFFRIGWLEFEMLARWHAGDAARVSAGVAAETPLAATPDDVAALAEFLGRNQLVRASSAQDTARLAHQRRGAVSGRLAWLAHHYLFFRVPLVRPERFLARTLPALDGLFTPAAAVAMLAVTVAGVLLAARQWDTFTHTLAGTLDPAGLLGYLAALAVAKSVHELGHAYTATRHGVRVGHMGVAFVVLWPMLYTDTGESWKLADRRRRFAIAAAGIVTEVGLAGLATLGWSLAPDGGLRQSLFFLATTSWLMTVAINASPFLRFDGYFLLSDALDFPNLHERSFAVARAFLRRALLGLPAPDPEPFAPRMRAFLIAFAVATWLWRLTVFVAIALLVYHFFFKALGVVLFALEIWWFVARPVTAELKVWWAERAAVPRRRRGVLVLLLLALVAVLFVPWQSDVHAPAWTHARQQHMLYSPLPARVAAAPRPAGAVRAGDVLFVLDSPDLRSRAAVSTITAGTLATQIERLQALPQGEERRAALKQELARELAEVRGDLADLARLEVRAPFDGELLDVDDALAPGTWVRPAQPLGMLMAPGDWIVEAYVEEAAAQRLRAGARARFHPANGDLAPVAGRVEAIDSTRAASLPHAMLAATHGGRIETTAESGKLAPRAALYRVRIALEAPPAAARTAPGTAVIAAERRSIGGDALRRAAAVLVRESGF